MVRLSRKIMMLLLLAALLLILLVSFQAEARTITVDDDGGADHKTIKAAIAAADTGDTIRVYNGTYVENFRFYKSVNLIGNGSSDTIIRDGGTEDYFIRVEKDGCTISGFTIDGNWLMLWSENNAVQDNNIKGVRGIYLDHSNGNTIINNTINATSGYGIMIDWSNDNEIINNTIEDGGIYLYRSGGNEVRNNVFNESGISMYMLGLGEHHQIIDDTNTVNGKPLLYYQDVRDFTVPAGAGQVILLNCSNIYVQDQNLSNSFVGLNLLFSHDIEVVNITANSNTGDGINIRESEDIFINDSICRGNEGDGIFVEDSEKVIIRRIHCGNNSGGINFEGSSDCVISHSNSTRNREYGIDIYNSDRTSVQNSTIEDNGSYKNIKVYGSDNCNFNNNTIKGNNGLVIDNSEDSIFTNNRFNKDGISLSGMIVKFWDSHSIDTSNTINSKPILYFAEEEDRTIDGVAGQIILANCHGITIENQTIVNQTNGVTLGFCEEIIVRNCYLSNNVRGIYSFKTDTSYFINNTIIHNEMYGIYLNYVDGIIIQGNNISKNDNGMYIYRGDNNKIIRNNIHENNATAIRLSYSRNNEIKGNTISKSMVGVYIDSNFEGIIISCNRIQQNSNYGVSTTHLDEPVNATFNYWGDDSGPYHPLDNSEGKGDTISDNATFDPWLTRYEIQWYESVILSVLDAELTSDPDQDIFFYLTVTNEMENLTNISAEAFEEHEFLATTFPDGNYINGLRAGEEWDFRVGVNIDEKCLAGDYRIRIRLYLRPGAYIEKFLNLTVHVNQIFDMQLALNNDLLQIYPGDNGSTELIIKNKGNGEDYFLVEVSTHPSITTMADPNLTDDIPPGNNTRIFMDFIVPPGTYPQTITLTINVTSMGSIDNEGRGAIVVESITIDIKIKEVYGVSFWSNSGLHQVTPTHDHQGTTTFFITIENTGTRDDQYKFEFADDDDTELYSYWCELPPSIELSPGETRSISFKLEIHPYHIDNLALADGSIRPITFRVYSDGARDNNQEIPGQTTREYICDVELLEYRKVSITSIQPASFIMDPGDTRFFNVSIKNEGNGVERYTFVKDGENGMGLNSDWYKFEPDSLLLAPSATGNVLVNMTPNPDAGIGIHSLEFHVRSESLYESVQHDLKVDINEVYNGRFISGDQKQSDPGRSVSMTIHVHNSGNDNNLFTLSPPVLPDGWSYFWEGDQNAKTINPDSSRSFTVNIVIPDDFTKARAGFYSFPISGVYNTDEGSRSISGAAFLNLTVNPAYRVRMTSNYSPDTGEPGDLLFYSATIRNIGNVNDTITLDILPYVDEDIWDGSSWVHITELVNTTNISLGIDKKAYLTIVITIPEYLPPDYESVDGEYRFSLFTFSQNDTEEDDLIEFRFHVEPLYEMDVWAGNEMASGFLYPEQETILNYTVWVTNRGNVIEDFAVSITDDQFFGETNGWHVELVKPVTGIITLPPISSTWINFQLIVDADTNPGIYEFHAFVESTSDGSVSANVQFIANLSKPRYGLELTRVEMELPHIDPRLESYTEFHFSLNNTGNKEDSYRLFVETLVTTGIYQDWEIFFMDHQGFLVDEINIPGDITGDLNQTLDPFNTLDISLFVKVPIHELGGLYEDIGIIAVSKSDPTRIAYENVSLWVLKPDIRISNDQKEFYIIPGSSIQQGDSVEIVVRIYNDGDIGTGNFTVWFYNSRKKSPDEAVGDPIGSHFIDNIYPMFFVEISVLWENLPLGENDIYVHADKPIKTGEGKTYIDGEFSSRGLVIEDNEQNNYASIADTFQEELDIRPDLAVVNVVFGTITNESSKTWVSVYVQNRGKSIIPSGQAYVKIKIGGIYLPEAETSSQVPAIRTNIQVNENVTITFIWILPEDRTKNYTVKASVDTEGDSDGTNDFLNTWIQIVKEPDPTSGNGDPGTDEDDNSPASNIEFETLIYAGIILIIIVISMYTFMVIRTNAWKFSDLIGKVRGRNQRKIEKKAEKINLAQLIQRERAALDSEDNNDPDLASDDMDTGFPHPSGPFDQTGHTISGWGCPFCGNPNTYSFSFCTRCGYLRDT